MQVNGVQPNSYKNNTNFGMALYMKDAKVFKKALGGNVTKNLEAARPVLEKCNKLSNLVGADGAIILGNRLCERV